MRILLKIVMVLLGIAAFFTMGGSAALWAYGQYGVPLIDEQLQALEDQIETSLEEDNPGMAVTIDITDIYYKVENWSPSVAFAVYSLVETELGGADIEEKTTYAVVDVMSIFSGEPTFETYEESEWEDVNGGFKAAPEILFDAEKAKQTGMLYFIIAAVVFVGSIVVNAVFLRKRRLAL